MAGWGDGQWGPMPWGGLIEPISRYIKITYIKVANYITAHIKSKQGS